MKKELESKTCYAKEPTKKELASMQKKYALEKIADLKAFKERQRMIFLPIFGGEILSIIDVRFYMIVEEMTGEEFGGKPFKIKYAMTPDGKYLGYPKTAYRLVNKYGIYTFRSLGIKPTSCCSIGYNPVKKLWYGWSHRAIYGFKSKQKAIRFANSVS